MSFGQVPPFTFLNLDSDGFLAEVGTASPWTTRWQCWRSYGLDGWYAVVTSAWFSAVACSRSLVPLRGEALLVVFVLRVWCLFVVLFSVFDGCGHLSQYLSDQPQSSHVLCGASEGFIILVPTRFTEVHISSPVSSMCLWAKDHLESTKVAVSPSLCEPQERPVRQRSGLAVIEE